MKLEKVSSLFAVLLKKVSAPLALILSRRQSLDGQVRYSRSSSAPGYLGQSGS